MFKDVPISPRLQPIHNHYEIQFNIILPFMPRSSKFALPLRFPQQKRARTSPYPIRTTTLAHHIPLYLITRKVSGDKYRPHSSSLHSILHSPVTSSLLRPNILLIALSSDTLNLRSSLNVRDQVSHPYRTTGKTAVLCILIFIFLYSKPEDKRSAPNDSKQSVNSICS